MSRVTTNKLSFQNWVEVEITQARSFTNELSYNKVGLKLLANSGISCSRMLNLEVLGRPLIMGLGFSHVGGSNNLTIYYHN